MNLWQRITSWLSRPAPQTREKDLERELHDHLELETEEQKEAGLSPEEARYAASRALGNTTRVKEDTRAIWTWSSLERLLQDLRYGLRVLRKSPGFVVIAVLTLSIGIGANVAIFTVVNAVLLRPLPFPQPDRLVRIFDDRNGSGAKDVGMSVPEMQDLRDRSSVFEQFTPIWPISAALVGGDYPDRIELLATSPEYFHLLGAQAALGRVYGPEDAVPGFSDPVVISDALWRRQFGGDPKVIGRKVLMDTDPYTIVGVMPRSFRHPGETVRTDVEMWTACGFTGSPFVNPPVRAATFLPGALGRLKPGLALQEAQSKLDAFADQLRATYPSEYPAASRWSLRLESVQDHLTQKVRPTLVVLLAAVGFVLLIACVNIASLLLARSAARVRELAVRQALGASRGRLVRQLLTESVLISLAGGLAAIAVLFGMKNSLLAFVPPDLPRLSEVHIDARIVGVAFLLSVLTGILFGLAPAWQVSSLDPNRDLKEAGRTGGGSARYNHFRSTLVAAEIALSLVLLIAAGLLMRSFWDMLQTNPGIDPKNLTIAQIWIPAPNNPQANPYQRIPARGAFVKEVLRQASLLPGVEQSAMGSLNSIPFVNGRAPGAFHFTDSSDTDSNGKTAQLGSISPNYFRVVKASLVRGRAFTDDDTDQKQKVAVVNEAFVQKYSPQSDPLGRPMRLGGGPNDTQIVGVVANIPDDGLDVPASPHIYLSTYQTSGLDMTLYLRTTSDPAALREAVVQAVHRVDPTLPVFGVRGMEDALSASMARRRFVLLLMGAFAVLALLLVVIGIYGLMSYAVSQHTQEFGIRMALGAQRRDIVMQALRPGLLLTLSGVLAGLAGAVAVTRLMSTLLFGVSPTDPLTFLAVPALLGLVALVACYIPARRAVRVDPNVALRYE
jgi:putative ABC transport system permease protein